jgi:hypothetical protein
VKPRLDLVDEGAQATNAGRNRASSITTRRWRIAYLAVATLTGAPGGGRWREALSRIHDLALGD